MVNQERGDGSNPPPEQTQTMGTGPSVLSDYCHGLITMRRSLIASLRYLKSLILREDRHHIVSKYGESPSRIRSGDEQRKNRNGKQRETSGNRKRKERKRKEKTGPNLDLQGWVESADRWREQGGRTKQSTNQGLSGW